METEIVVCLGCGGLVDAPLGTYPQEPRCECRKPNDEARTLKCSACGGHLALGVRACPFCAATVATCRCPSCFAWNVADAEYCQRCGSTLPETLSEGTRGSRRCPHCLDALTQRTYAEFDVEECDRCGGLFVGQRMMQQIVDANDQHTELHLALPKRTAFRDVTVRYVPCPVCTSVMNRKAFGRISGVVVDVCRDHGIWFDRGELADVVAFVQNGGLVRARQREQDELSEQGRAQRVELLRAKMAQQLGDERAEDLTWGTMMSFGREVLRIIADLWRGSRQ